MSEIQHEIVTDTAGVVRVDGVEEDLAVALARFAVEASELGAPVLVKTTEPAGEPLVFQVDKDMQMTPVEDSSVGNTPPSDTRPGTVGDPIENPTPQTPRPSAGETPSEASPADVEAAGPRIALPLSRRALIGAGVVGAIAIGVGAAAWLTNLAAGEAKGHSAPVASPTGASVVVMPGWSSRATWSTRGIDAAASAGGRVIGIAGSKVRAWDAVTGREVSTATLAGSGGRVLAGTVGKEPAVAAVSDSQALIWVGRQPAPLVLDLSGGRSLESRSGGFFIAGPEWTFWIVTATGEIPLTAPGSQLIVLGGDVDAIMWATGAGHVITASTNGTVLVDATLAAPAAGAVVTPRSGWLRASTATVTVVGWTLPTGETATGIHSTKTGALIGTIPGAGKGLLRYDRGEWVTDGQRVSLEDGTQTPLPAGFIPARFLGGNLLGAQADGGDALLTADASSTTPLSGVTIQPIAVTDHNVLVALTSGQLAVFPPMKSKH